MDSSRRRLSRSIGSTCELNLARFDLFQQSAGLIQRVDFSEARRMRHAQPDRNTLGSRGVCRQKASAAQASNKCRSPVRVIYVANPLHEFSSFELDPPTLEEFAYG